MDALKQKYGNESPEDRKKRKKSLVVPNIGTLAICIAMLAVGIQYNDEEECKDYEKKGDELEDKGDKKVDSEDDKEYIDEKQKLLTKHTTIIFLYLYKIQPTLICRK